jgi:malate dehydrogenase (oxaloacetate-decarboxylating)(NADP+)
VRATEINEEMKAAAAHALAALAREDVPDDVAAAYAGNRPKFGPGYIIPVPFDPRLISAIPVAVAKAAIETGVARREIADFEAYANQLSARRDPIASTLQRIYERVRRHPQRIVFTEGEEEQMIRAAVSYVNQQLGTAILLGREDQIRATAKEAGADIDRSGIEVINARLSHKNSVYSDFLYERLQRAGYLFRDCQRMINNDRNHFAATMVALGDADGMVTGVTRNYSTALADVRRVIDARPGHRVIGMSLALCRGRTVLVADTAVHDMPSAEELADIAEEAAGMARRMGYNPRVAMLAYSTFGHPPGERSNEVRDAVRILDKRRVDFEYDGEMAADVALNAELMAQYPFCRLSKPANVLIMPAFHSASIATKMLQELGGSTVIGPLLVGLNKPVQIVSLGAKDADIVNMAAIAAYNARQRAACRVPCPASCGPSGGCCRRGRRRTRSHHPQAPGSPPEARPKGSHDTRHQAGASTQPGRLLFPSILRSRRRDGSGAGQPASSAVRHLRMAVWKLCDLLQMLHELKPSKCIFGLQQTRRNPSSGSAAT